jgi:DHA1 family multidrug resistance protein-like MFS transporter
VRFPFAFSRPLARSQLSARDRGSAQRHVGVGVLLSGTFLMNLGFNILVPLLAIHFTANLGFTAAAIGLVLALRQFAQQSLDLFSGILGDRIGARTSIAAGCLIRAVGFLGIGYSHTLAELLWWALVAGVGGAFFDAPGTAALADLVAPEQHQRAFAASATCGNLGAAIGPLIGVALLGDGFGVVGVVAALCFAVLGLLTLALLPGFALRGAAPEGQAREAEMRLGATLRLLWRDKTFLWLTVLLSGFWFIWAQINITVPLAAARLGGAPLAALALSVNAGLAIVLQYPLSQLAGRHWTLPRLLVICTAVSAVGMALVFALPLVATLFAGIVVFALGRMVMGPVINSATAALAPAGKFGAYFGFGALAIAVGASGGQLAGGALYDVARRLDLPVLLWGSMLLAGVVVMLGLARLRLPE